MRSIFVAAVAAACLLVSGAGYAEGCTIAKRPLVTVQPTPLGAAVLTAEIGGM